MLNCDFRTIFEPEYHYIVRFHRHLVDDCKPQFFIKLIDNLRPLPDIADKAFDNFALTEPLPLGGFQLVDPLRGTAMPFKVGVVALHPLRLIDGSSCVFINCLSGEFGDNLNLSE